MAGFSFRASARRSLRRFRDKISRVTAALGARIVPKKLEENMLMEIKNRFAPAGSKPGAQTAPDGVPWVRPHPSHTVPRRRKNRAGYSQALVDRGTLLRSIKVLEKKMGQSQVESRAGGFIRVGVDPRSPAHKYARVQQTGGYTPQGSIIPARPFIGFSRKGIQGYLDGVAGQVGKALRS